MKTRCEFVGQGFGIVINNKKLFLFFLLIPKFINLYFLYVMIIDVGTIFH